MILRLQLLDALCIAWHFRDLYSGRTLLKGAYLAFLGAVRAIFYCKEFMALGQDWYKLRYWYLSSDPGSSPLDCLCGKVKAGGAHVPCLLTYLLPILWKRYLAALNVSSKWSQCGRKHRSDEMLSLSLRCKGSARGRKRLGVIVSRFIISWTQMILRLLSTRVDEALSSCGSSRSKNHLTISNVKQWHSKLTDELNIMLIGCDIKLDLVPQILLRPGSQKLWFLCLHNLFCLH